MKPVKTMNVDGDPVFAFEINDMTIYNLTMSECGRFSVDPLEYYGVTTEQVKTLENLNKSFGYSWEI